MAASTSQSAKHDSELSSQEESDNNEELKTSISRVPARGRSASRSPERDSQQHDQVVENDTIPTRDVSHSFGKFSAMSAPFTFEDNLRNKSEMKILRSQLRQTQSDLRNEQDSVLQLRRRLNIIERERLDEGTKANEEIVNWQTQVTKQRCQIERKEAAKQNTEFELAKARREMNAERKNAADRDVMLKTQIDNLKEQVGTQDRHLQELQHQIQVQRHATNEHDNHHRNALEEKDRESMKLLAEIDVLVAERERLDIVIQEKEGGVSDLSETVQELEDKLRHQGDTIRRQIAEIEFGKEREDRIKKDLETALHRLRALEDGIEAERAAHLESKFNSEITQLRIRDLESALEAEKNQRSENTNVMENLQKQLREIERSYHQDALISQQKGEKLTNLEKEYAAVKQQLSEELEDKNGVVQNLSKQLQLHERNFEELKDELTKAKKRQAYLEETYGGSMRELELLLDNFNVDAIDKKKRSRKSDASLSSQPKPISPSLVLENLRHTLMEYKRKLNMTSEELTKMKKHCENLGKECDSYKDMIWTKDRALEDTQKGYSKSSKELNRLRSEVVELEALMAAMKVELQGAVQGREKEKARGDDINEEMLKMSKRFKVEDEEKMGFMHMLYQRLMAGQVLSEPKGQLLSYTWFDLSNMVHEQVSALLSAVHRAEEKVKHYENIVVSKEEAMEQMQKSHEHQYQKLEDLAQEREKTWQKQKSELEEHYTRMLAEVHVRSKKSQTLADQAWERVRATGSVQQGLEGELMDLRNHLERIQAENSSLLSACALLAGAFFPMYNRYTSLVGEHGFLEEQLMQHQNLHQQAKNLVSMLDTAFDVDAELTPPGKRSPAQLNRSPIMMFRMAGLAVIAANRLAYFANSSCKMFTSYDLSTGLAGLAVSTGGAARPQKLRGVGLDIPTTDKILVTAGQEKAASWLTSEDLKACLMNSTVEVQDALSAGQRGGGVDAKLVTGAARNSFAKLMDKLQVFFNQPLQENGFRDKASLVRILSNGLNQQLAHTKPKDKLHLSSSQQTMSQLQCLILELTQNLHGAEVDCRNLQVENKNLSEDNFHMKSIAGKAMDLEKESKKQVELERFESVCQELSNALSREQQAQGILNEQGGQLEELTSKLGVISSEESQRQSTYSEAVQGLSEARFELKQKEQIIRQVNKHLTQLEMDNQELLDNVRDAEHTLRSTARDRDVLQLYVKNIEDALEKAKHQMAMTKTLTAKDTMLAKVLLSSDLMPVEIGKAGPHVLACQNLVTAFIDTQHQIFGKFLAMEEELEGYRRHIETLKRELNAACLREFNAEQEPMHESHGLSYDPVISVAAPTRDTNEYGPLVCESDSSFSVLQPSSPGKLSAPRSPNTRKSKSEPFQTPSLSAKSSMRSKPYNNKR
ncbi:coiled-coil domain-containing protein 171-like isoform X2 [Lineus longissimus]|uniref:coiled-coil domain-containing protein 171-like isoform X2 n=1 Tax=Lineus longissimus TaxID=88925 RepID=UPI00315CC1F8